MNFEPIPLFTSISSLALIFTSLCLWVIRKALVWGVVLVIVGGITVASKHLSPLGMFILIIYAGIALTIKWIAKAPTKVLLQIVFAVLSLMLIMHLLPGFNNYRILNQVVIKPGCVPYTFYLNFDKPFVGILILGLLHPLLRSKNAWLLAIKRAFPLFLLEIIVLFLFSTAIHLIRFQPSTPPFLIYWLFANLFFVSMPEEAFARGLLLRFFIKLTDSSALHWVANVGIAFLLTGLHYYFSMQLPYAILVFLANLFYGWIYMRSESIEMAILSHYLINTIHLLFFSYPFLA